MRKIKTAFVGCGRISDHYKKLLITKKVKNIEVVATCDKNNQKAKKLAKVFNCKHYSSIKKLIENNGIDLIFLLTPSGLHFENAKYILEKKINILIEKPTAFHSKEIKILSKIAKKNKLIACTAFQNRFNPSIQYLRKCLNQNKFGKIITASVRLRWCRYNAYYQDGWHGTWKMDGGVTNQQAIHHIDCLVWLLGPIDKVSSLGTKRLNKLEAEDTLVSIGKLKNGGLFTIEVTTAARPKDFEASLSVVGEKGLIEIGGIGLNKIEKCEFTNSKINLSNIKKKYSEKIDNGYGKSHIQLINQITYNLQKKIISSPVPVESTLKTCDFVNAIYKSDEDKKWVKTKNSLTSKRLGT